MCIIAYCTLYWFIFQRRLCISLHISDNVVYFASYCRQDCVFASYFRQDYFNLLHISDKIVYFASYFRQYCIFDVCPVNFNCDAGNTYCHWCIFDLNEKWVTFQIIYLCNQCISELELNTNLCGQVYQCLMSGTVAFLGVLWLYSLL